MMSIKINSSSYLIDKPPNIKHSTGSLLLESIKKVKEFALIALRFINSYYQNLQTCKDQFKGHLLKLYQGAEDFLRDYLHFPAGHPTEVAAIIAKETCKTSESKNKNDLDLGYQFPKGPDAKECVSLVGSSEEVAAETFSNISGPTDENGNSARNLFSEHSDSDTKKIVPRQGSSVESSVSKNINTKKFERRDQEIRAANLLLATYKKIVEPFATRDPLFTGEKRDLYFSQLVIIRNPGLKNSILSDLKLFLELNHSSVLNLKRFEYSGAPLFPIYILLRLLFEEEDADDLYDKVYRLRKVFKKREVNTSFLAFLLQIKEFFLFQNNYKPAIKLLINYALENKNSMNISERSQSLKEVISRRGLYSTFESDFLESLSENSNDILLHLKNAQVNIIFKRLDLKNEKWKTDLLQLSVERLNVLMGLINSVIASSSLDVDKSLVELVKNILKGEYEEHHYELPHLTDSEKEIWKKNSTIKFPNYTINETDNPWEMLLATTKVFGCLSILSPNNGGGALYGMLLREGCKLITIIDTKGVMQARAYFYLYGKKINVQIFKCIAEHDKLYEGDFGERNCKLAFVNHLNAKLKILGFEQLSIEDVKSYGR